MGRKATHKDFYMEIRKSCGRFMSILLIVALGVAFFSGIRSSQPDMLATGDAHFDKADLMDIKVMSTLGLTEDDVAAMERLGGVKKAEGSYSVDMLCMEENSQNVLHLMSVTEKLNHITVTEGRMPKKSGECLVDDMSGYQIGDMIMLSASEGDTLEDSLKEDQLKVIGRGNSASYISHERGSSQIGTGAINSFAVVSKDSFTMEAYSEVYISVKGAKELEAYSQEYEDIVEDATKELEEITKERGNIRKEEIKKQAQTDLETAKKELEDGKKTAEEELGNAQKSLLDAETKLHTGRQQVADGETAITSASNILISKQKELDAAKIEYQNGLTQWEAGMTSYEEGVSVLQQNKDTYGPQIEGFRSALTEARATLDEGWKQYQQMEEMVGIGGITAEVLEQTKAGLDAGESDYATKLVELQQLEKGLLEGEAKLQQAKSELDQSQAVLVSAWNQIESGQSQIDAGWNELYAQSAQLPAAKEELKKGEKEFSEGKASYEEAKAETEQKINDGVKEIEKAEKEIEKIKEPKWYLNDRTDLPAYSGFGDNADRMKAIGQVFPVLFFLVAALISLTSMTRMVEEQRTQIGTMKALGYSKFAIASKYLGYALLATLGGSILGVLVGEKVLPYIIIVAYRSLYYSMTTVVIPYNMHYALMATGAAVVCTMGATIISCYRELACEPAMLMRPPAPKKGKRVFLERVTFVWKRLSFIWKSTIRNLFRYKKRFFMTVFGIGGCMALILVGFGLRDSILGIGDIQYQEIEVYDADVYLQEDLEESEREGVYENIEKDIRIKDYLSVGKKRVTLINGEKEWDVYRTVPADASKIKDFVNLRDRITKKEQVLDDSGMILSEKAAKSLGVKVGDTVEIEDINSENKTIKVSNICENYMGHSMYISPKLYETVYGETPEYNSICFQMTKDSQSQLNQVGKNLLKQEGVMYVSYLDDIAGQLEDMLKSLNMVMVVLIISAGLLAFIVLYNLNNINITERKRELATIKVLGFYDMEVGAYVYRENMILTLAGALAGIAMGFVLHAYVIQTVEVDDVMFGRVIHGSSYLFSTLFTFAFSLFVNWVMFFKLKKIDMVESLKSVE